MPTGFFSDLELEEKLNTLARQALLVCELNTEGPDDYDPDCFDDALDDLERLAREWLES